MNVIIERVIYHCHPETCNHRNHLPWCVKDEKSWMIIEKFQNKEDAKWFCSKHSFKYIIKELTWNDIT